MRRVSATSPRAHSAIAMVSLLLLLMQLSSTATANASQCATDGQLSAGAASCSPACSAEGTAACLTLRPSSTICSPGNVTSVTAGCPLVQSRDCLVECLPWSETALNNTFTFYVVPQALAPANASDWASSVLWQNQQYVTSIGAMAMPDRIKYVSIIGGTPTRALAPGVNVNVQVALSLSGANVTNLTLAGLNLGDDDPSPVSVSQSRLASLTVQNCNLTAPVDTSALPALTTLDLSQNNISAFTSDYSMESLRHLNLSNNSLTNFGAVFPALETLDLSYNNLVEIPSNVYLFSNLQALDMSGNYLTNPSFSRDHYEFLNNLSSLSISGFVNSPSCKPESQQVLRAQVVCVVDTTNLVVISKSSLTWYIVIPIVATAIVSITGFSLWYHRRKKHHAKEERRPRTWTKNATGQLTQDDDADSFVRFNENPLGSGSAGTSSGHKYAAGSSRQLQASGSLWSDEELLAWQLRYEDIEDVKQIGMGAFAVVWLVKYRQTRQLASKRLVRDQINRQKTQDFVAEIKLNSMLDHPSIVQFVGAAWTIETDLQALFEYMPNGDLRGFLHSTRGDSSQCEWTRQKVQIAVEITEALVYVHSFTPPLVHRDLKSKNVLLGDDMKAKLSDFGVSRFASDHGTMTAGVGTGKWLAPEVLSGADYDQMCDIYSLGVVLSELDTHASPYEELKLADVALLQLVLSGDARPRFSEHCPPEIRAVADKCLAFDPANRPSAMEIAFTLRTFAKTFN